MEIRYHGHSCFELSDGDTRILVDPFLAPNNPAATASAGDVDPTHIVISHGHADHMADAVGVAKANGSECIAVVEIAKWLEEQGVETVYDPNLGGTVRFEWGWVKLVPAWHTSTLPGSAESPFSPTSGTVIGTPAGLLVNLGGETVYHAGDTCLFGDMKLIAERNPVDVAMLPIGGHYTMDRHDAAVAAEFVGAGTVIPMHFDTFPAIETDSQAFKSAVEEKTSSTVVVLAPGQSHATG
jgi:L-ascorbate metabolism protein UlaG (beta-lactamase superfamily)